MCELSFSSLPEFSSQSNINYILNCRELIKTLTQNKEKTPTGKFLFFREVVPRSFLLLLQARVCSTEGLAVWSVWQRSVQTVTVHRQRHISLLSHIWKRSQKHGQALNKYTLKLHLIYFWGILLMHNIIWLCKMKHTHLHDISYYHDHGWPSLHFQSWMQPLSVWTRALQHDQQSNVASKSQEKKNIHSQPFRKTRAPVW